MRYEAVRLPALLGTPPAPKQVEDMDSKRRAALAWMRGAGKEVLADPCATHAERVDWKHGSSMEGQS